MFGFKLRPSWLSGSPTYDKNFDQWQHILEMLTAAIDLFIGWVMLYVSVPESRKEEIVVALVNLR